ncbi:MAG: thiol reductant ABC exporter subunit CydD [Moraxellaceae bacterium]|nr:thiol reductant ABC exporter subunit CydD [Moraxellaceae bacterium]MBS9779110.1 thiol reductant ABC exporter subunit CydD [Moraxellaceae bacterium]
MAKLTSEEKQLLKDLIAPVKHKLNLAWLMSIFATLIFVAQSWILATIFSEWLNQKFANEPLSIETLWQWLFCLLGCFFLRPIFTFFQQLIGAKASLTVRTNLRQRLLSALAELGMARQEFGSDGNLSSQVIEQTDALDGYISRFVVQKKVVASTPIILLLACAWQSPVVAGILFLTAPLVPIFMILIGSMTARKSEEQFEALAQLSGRFLDWVRGMTTLKRLQATERAEKDLTDASEDYRHRTMDVLKIAFLNGAVLEFLSALCIALVAVYLGLGLLGILPWAKEYVPVNYFGALFILLLTPEFYAPLRQLGMDYHAQAHAQGAVKSLLPLLKRAETLQELHNHSTENVNLDFQKPLTMQIKELAIYHKIYDENSKETITRTRLKPISFDVGEGEHVGLVGESGSGKSSLMQALMGFTDYQGEIFINGINHKQLNISELRENIGYLAQQVALLPISIADNLRLAKADATDKELMEVLKAVDLYELIEQLPNSMYTVLGERGQGLSGGQQQRLGVAQLLLRENKLWLLDEPTEHLDSDTAETIHTLLEKVSRDKTVIWITHSVEKLTWLDRLVKIQQ